MLNKLLICPYFGDLPEWFDKWEKNSKSLEKFGYKFLIDQDLDSFNDRCERILGFRSPIVPGQPKVWDYRCALGLLYSKELVGYDYWGHADFDVIFGRIDKFIPDDILKFYDIFSDEKNYVGGHFTLYKNTHEINILFKSVQNWQSFMSDPAPNGWVEKEFTQAVISNPAIMYKFEMNQATRENQGLTMDESGSLFQHGREVMLAHFKDQKRWMI